MTSIKIEPYESLVEDAIRLLEEQLGSSVLSKVKEIKLDAVAPDHYGQVISNEPGVVHLSLNRIRSELNSMSEEELVATIASVLAHETGHLDANFQGGESPAEAREQEFINKLRSSKARYDTRALVSLANTLDINGLTKYADLLDDVLYKKADYVADPEGTGKNVAGLIKYMADRVSPENRRSFLESFTRKIYELNTSDVTSRKKNPTAGIGAMSGLLKNMLAGLDSSNVRRILNSALKHLREI